jgi:hypothetical protein
MTNVNASIQQILPAAGAGNDGLRMGLLVSTAKAAQNDTITIKGIKGIKDADLRIVATGATETYTISGTEITCTSATTGNVRGIIYYY